MAGKLWGHGGVLIQTVEEVAGGGIRRSGGILAYCGGDGHSHRVETLDRAELWQVRDTLYLRVVAPTRIVHEEHRPLSLEPGVYRVWQQREYVPASQQRGNGGVSFRTVRD